jgi:5-methylcytosine-specific restriction endonuclease McrA
MIDSDFETVMEYSFNTRPCLREPIPEIFDAARFLDAAVSAHTASRVDLAEALFRLADLEAVREWTDSLWGAASPYLKRMSAVQSRSEIETTASSYIPSSVRRAVLMRDGHHCRFCGIPVVSAAVRRRIHERYPATVNWSPINKDQHAAFQCLWLQYDHLVPRSRGGTSHADNIVITCAGCNFGRMESLLSEVGLTDPRTREPRQSVWDGLERFM